MRACVHVCVCLSLSLLSLSLSLLSLSLSLSLSPLSLSLCASVCACVCASGAKQIHIFYLTFDMVNFYSISGMSIGPTWLFIGEETPVKLYRIKRTLRQWTLTPHVSVHVIFARALPVTVTYTDRTEIPPFTASRRKCFLYFIPSLE